MAEVEAFMPESMRTAVLFVHSSFSPTLRFPSRFESIRLSLFPTSDRFYFCNSPRGTAPFPSFRLFSLLLSVRLFDSMRTTLRPTLPAPFPS